MCRDCGQVVACPRCSSPLAVHRVGDDDELLRCHTCGHWEGVPVFCPSCWSTRIRQFGVGTQRVAATVAELFPQARVVRWDRDVTGRKGAHERLLRTVLDHEADVIVGTQMIAKGLDLPLVTLVGVVSADTGLHLPDFRAGERTFQLMTQVAGRSGRRDLGGQVILQSYNPDHYALRAAAEHDYAAFFREEIAFRSETRYPPFSRLARFVVSSTRPESARNAAEELAGRIEALLAAATAARCRDHRPGAGIYGARARPEPLAPAAARSRCAAGAGRPWPVTGLDGRRGSGVDAVGTRRWRVRRRIGSPSADGASATDDIGRHPLSPHLSQGAGGQA